jgi:hypothetical protein
MAKNTNPGLLDAPQIVKRVYDSDNDAIRVEVGVGTGFALNLSADSGDSISSVPTVTEQKASITTANTGVIIPATSCIGMKSFNLYTNTTSAITGAQVCTLEVSPSDSDNVWKATSLTITPSGTNGTVVMGTVATGIVARRMRVSIASAISSGTFDIYLVAQSV